MLIIQCPYCGARPEIEFSHGGQAHLTRPRDPAAIDDEAWSDFLYGRDNAKGPHRERWRHIHGCGKFFNAIRDTRTDRFLITYGIRDVVELPAS